MIGRSPTAAAEVEWDVVIVGGGVYGALASLEATRRGLKTLLLERDDFGGATSASSLRILHGGLRYLQSFNFPRYRRSIAERRWFLANFPDLVEPLPCLMPLYGDGLRRPSVLRVALALDDRLSRRRNDGLPPTRHLLAGGVLSTAETLELYPGAESPDLSGAALWNDAVMTEAPRLLIEILRWAATGGALALNYCEAFGLETADGRVTAVIARDRTDGQRYRLRTKRVANCAGPWASELAAAFELSVDPLPTSTLAFNLLLDHPPPAKVAVAMSSPSTKRSYFALPWRDRVLVGTAYSPERSPLDTSVSAFLEEVRNAFPGLAVGPDRVLRVLSGRLPAAPGSTAEPAAGPTLLRHEDRGGPRGVVTVVGEKYTTARATAVAALELLCGSDLPDARKLERPPAARWPRREEVLTSPTNPELGVRLRELVHQEAALTRDDVLLRRTDWGLIPAEGREIESRLSNIETSPLSTLARSSTDLCGEAR